MTLCLGWGTATTASAQSTPPPPTPAPSGKIYFTDSNNSGAARAKILRSNLDGSNVELLVTPPALNPRFIALDVAGGKMYWTDIGTILRANLDGNGVQSILSGGSFPCPTGIALDTTASKVYWTDCSANKIQRANLDGTSVQDVLVGLSEPRGLALDLARGKMHWTETSGRRIRRANLDGTVLENLVVGLQFPQGIALDVAGGKMYWGDDGKIQRANLDGSGLETLVPQIVVGGFTGNPLGIALDLPARKVYWTETTGKRIQRANLDGTGLENLVTSGLDTPWGIAVIPGPPVAFSIVNTASFILRPLAAGSQVSLFGNNLASTTLTAASLPLPTQLGGTSVFLNGIAAPLFSVSPSQIILQVPWELSGQTQASVVVVRDGISSAPQTVSIAPFDPGIFTQDQSGKGPGTIRLANGELITAANPARRGEVVLIHVTGLGAVTNQPASGSAALSSPLALTTSPPTVVIDGIPAQVFFSGLTPGLVAQYQVNVGVPANTRAGDSVPVVLTIGGVASNTVTIAIETLADLTIAVTDSPDPVTSGGTLTYTITVQNVGPFSAASVTVTDTLPANVTFQSCSVACTQSGNSVTVNLGTLAAGASTSFGIVVTAPTVTSPTFITNTASVTTTSPEVNTANNQGTETTTVNPPAGPGKGITAMAIDPANPATIYAATTGNRLFKSTNGGVSWTVADTGLVGTTVFSLVIDPTNSATLYAGTIGRRVFKSTDGGASWSAASSGLTDPTVLSLAIDPANPSTLYAGTAGGAFFPGRGVFKSTDGGQSWTVANSGLPAATFEALAIDPSNPATLYAGTNFAGVFKSTNGGQSWTAANSGMTNTLVTDLVVDPGNAATLYAATLRQGAFKSTNGGISWTAINSGLADLQVVSLAIDPVNTGTLYAGTRLNGVFKSSNGGTSWTAVNSTLTSTSFAIVHLPLAIDPLNPTTLFAGTANGVFKSTDGGATWQPTGSSTGKGAPPATTISKVSGDNQTGAVGQTLRAPFVVVVTNASGIPVPGVGVTFSITAGGGSIFGFAPAIGAITDAQGVAVLFGVPGVPPKVTLGPNPGTNTVTATAAGLTGSPITFTATALPPPADLSITMTDSPDPAPSGGSLSYTIVVQNIGVFPANNVTATDPLPAGVSFVSCIAFVGSCSATGGTVTASLGTLAAGQSLAVTIRATVPTVSVLTFLTNTVSVATTSPEITTTNNQASAATTVNPTPSALPGGGPPGGTILSLAIDPSTPGTIYAGTAAGVFKSTSGGTHWTSVSPTIAHLAVFSLALDLQAPARIYAGTYGGLFKSADAGASWTASNSGLTASIILSVVIDPAAPTTLYAGTFSGGVFKSTNSGQNWVAANAGLTNKDVLALAIDPLNPTIVYAGTGAGVFKSINGGVDWSRIYPSEPASNGPVIFSVAVDPVSPLTLYAGFGKGILKSTNGGATWTVVNNGLFAPFLGRFNPVKSVAIDPANPATLYAGTFSGGVFKSANGGQNWAAAKSGLTATAILSLAVDPSNPGTVYTGTFSGGVFKTTNGGQNWAGANSGLTATVVFSLAVDRGNPANLYAGTGAGVFKSSNGGVSWKDANAGLTNTLILALAIDPTNSSTIYAGTFNGGVFKSTDGGTSWTAANFGLTTPIVLSLAVDPSNPAIVYAGTFYGRNFGGGGVFKSTNGGQSWSAINSRLRNMDVLALAVDPTAPAKVYAGTGRGVFRSTNGGQTWTAQGTGLGSKVTFALSLDPADPATIYAGTGAGVYKSTDAGARWTAINSGLPATFLGLIPVKALAAFSVNPTSLYAGIPLAGIFKSTDGGASWVGANSGLAATFTLATAFDPANPATIYSGTFGGGVFKSSDGGVSWQPTGVGTEEGIIPPPPPPPPAAPTPLPAPPVILLSPGELTFRAFVGTNPPSQTFSITNTGGGTLNWTAAITSITGGNWMTLSRASGRGDFIVTGTVDGSGLPLGNYNATVTISSPGAPNTPQTLTVSLTLAPKPTLVVNPSSLNFIGSLGSNPAAQQLTISSSEGAVTWTASASTSSGGNWLSLSPTSGSTPATVTVAVNIAGLAAGTYQGTITISAPEASNSPQTVSVTLILGTPAIALKPNSLVFITSVGRNPASQSFEVQNAGSGVLGWTATLATQSGGNWLSASPVTAVAPSTITISVNSAGLSAGAYTATITIAALPSVPASNSPQIVTVGLAVDAPAIYENGVVNSASFSREAVVSPGSIASLFGTNLATTMATATLARQSGYLPERTGTNPALSLPTILAGTQVLVNSIPAPLFYVSPTQINFQMPPDVSGPAVQVVVVSAGIRGLPVSVQVAPARPAIFSLNQSGSGPGAILNQDFSPNSAANPAARGSVVQVFATGLGATNPTVPSGQAAPSSPLAQAVVSVEARIGDRPAAVQFAGLAPSFVGLYQVNIEVPADVQPGSEVPLVLFQSGVPSNTVTLAVQ